MFKPLIALLVAAQCSMVSANILWDEDINGDLSGVFGSGPSFDLMSGDNFVKGRTPGGSSAIGFAALAFDVFSVKMPTGTVLNSISFS
jgi:hypothetical protein